MSRNRIIWAVDPFSIHANTQRATAKAIQALVKDCPSIVEPVYVTTTQPNNKLRSIASTEFSNIFSKIEIPGLKRIVLVPSHGRSKHEMITTLISHARASRAEMIVVGKRTKKSSRWMMGSFAETLLFNAGIPTLVIAPTWRHSIDLKHILLATDFSHYSRFAFLQVVRFAKKHKSDVTLFHQLERTPNSEMDLKLGAYYSFENYLTERRQEAERDLAQWSAEARNFGVPTRAMIDTGLNRDVSESILRISENKKMMIALTAHSSPISEAVLGSTARKIIRASERPVWVLSPPRPSTISTEKESLRRRKEMLIRRRSGAQNPSPSESILRYP